MSSQSQLPVKENGELVGMLTIEDIGQPARAATEEDCYYCYDGRERETLRGNTMSANPQDGSRPTVFLVAAWMIGGWTPVASMPGA